MLKRFIEFVIDSEVATAAYLERHLNSGITT